MRGSLLFALFVSSFASSVQAAEITGKAKVYDGDTISIGETRIRLHGIDAPEKGQRCASPDGKRWRCGRSSTQALQKLIAGGNVTCQSTKQDDFGREIAVCTVAGREINAAMVSAGWAWAFLKYSLDYVGQERAARTAMVGVWRSPSAPPWVYRARRWEFAKNQKTTRPGCPIKGNINRDGQRIYHAPWDPSYSRTRVSLAKGER